MSPAAWTWTLAFAIYAAAKVAVLALDRRRLPQRAPWIAWLLLWPGMEPARDLRRRRPRGEPGALVMSTACAGAGLAALLTASVLSESAETTSGVLAALGAVLVLHFGAFRMLAAAWHAHGHDVRPLMRSPLAAPSLTELWGGRWNTAFSALARRFVAGPLEPLAGKRAAILAVFVVSGLLHELVLTVPAGGGWGGPTAYFVLQGLGVLAEHGLRPSRAFAWIVALAPLPLLLPPVVLTRVAAPLATALFPRSLSMSESLLSVALWLAVLAHACVLVAGVQVPRALRWDEELPRLSRFNRRLVRVYHLFMGLVIVGFGALTAALHEEMLRGDRAAVGLAILVALFWSGRLIVDVFVYRHEDWPPGRRFAVGHALLAFAFVGMASAYWMVVARAVA